MPGQAVRGEVPVPPAVVLLNRLGVPAGPETAYAIALQKNFVPTVGDKTEHALWAQPLTAEVPMAG